MERDKLFLQKKKRRRGFQPRTEVPLTLGDVKYISEIDADYRIQIFIFSLLQYAKSHQDEINSLPLPKNLITKFRGCTDRTYQDRMRFCQSIGLIEQVSRHNRYQGLAKTFKINYRFQAGKEALTFEEGLQELFCRKEIKRKYSPYFVRKMSKMQQ